MQVSQTKVDRRTAASDAVSLMLHGYVRTQLVCVAAKIGLADHLSGGPLRSDDVAKLTGIAAPLMYRLMRGFLTCGLVKKRENASFELTPLGEVLKTGVPGSIRDLAIRIHDIDYPAWGEFLRAVRAGDIPFNSVFKMGFYEYLAKHGDYNEVFNLHMTADVATVSSDLLAVYDFSTVRDLVDVGGGYGYLLIEILKMYQSSSGVLFDLPSVTPRALECIKAAQLESRCQIAAGDFFRSVPQGADLYMLKLILHNWNDDRCIQVLRNCRTAMGVGRKLLVLERLMPAQAENAAQAIGLDLTMLTLVGGGERTLNEYEGLLVSTGFAIQRIVALHQPFHLLEAKAV